MLNMASQLWSFLFELLLKRAIQICMACFILYKKCYFEIFHDRFIVIDNKILYHVGASLKDLGKKCFAISKIEDIEYIEKINEKCKYNCFGKLLLI